MITRDLLNRFCCTAPRQLTDEAAFDACRALGPFSRYWLPPRVRRLARGIDTTYPVQTAPGWPMLRGEPGACTLILARARAWKTLGRALLLPLAWRRDQPHRGIPKNLRDLADVIVKQFVPPSKETWGLVPNAPAWNRLFPK